MKRDKEQVVMPLYLKDFSCVGGSCEDNCCIGWDVEIDQSTYEKYNGIKEKELVHLVSKRIFPKEDCFDPRVDYAYVELLKGNRCPFLNEAHLCKLQAKLGEAWLSNVCATYPRLTNRVNGVLEYSATVSCPEAARLILGEPSGILFSEAEEKPLERTIINCSLKTGKEGAGTKKADFLCEHFILIRKKTIELLQDRRFGVEERLLRLKWFYEALEEAEKRGEKVDLKRLEKGIEQKQSLKQKEDQRLRDPGEKISVLPLQFQDLRDLTKKTNRGAGLDSLRFLRFLEEFEQGLRVSGKDQRVRSEEDRYREAHARYYVPFCLKNDFIFENYLVNFVYSELFPICESSEPMEAFEMLLVRYALIRHYLIGLAAFHQGLNKELVIQFLQTFSKGVEHHHTYLSYVSAYLKRGHKTLLKGVFSGNSGSS